MITPENPDESPNNKGPSAEVRNEAKKMMSGNFYRHRKLVLVVYILILILVLATIWASLLLIPLIIVGGVEQKSTSENRSNLGVLKWTLTNNQQYLPLKCQINTTETEKGNISAPTIDCPELYIFNCSSCVPICGLWHPHGPRYYIGYRVVVTAIGVGDLIVAVFGIITLSCIKGSLRYPQAAYYFMFVNGFIYSLFYCALAIPGPYYTYCSARYEDYASVVNNPPIQVNIIGAVLHYVLVSFNLWFVFVTINIFIQVFFPTFNVLSRKKLKNTLYIIALIVSTGIPLVLPVIVCTISDTKCYTFERDPQIPFPKNYYFFLVFSAIPTILSVEVGLTLLTLSVFKLRMHKLAISTDKKQIKLKGFEIRFLIFSFLVWISILIVVWESVVVYHSEVIVEYLLEEYWSCLTLQQNPFLRLANQTSEESTCVARYRDHLYPIFNSIADLSAGIWGIFMLILLTTKESRDIWKHLIQSIWSKSVSSFKVVKGSLETHNSMASSKVAT